MMGSRLRTFLRDPFEQFAVLLVCGTLGLLVLDVYWIVAGQVVTIPHRNGTGGQWVSKSVHASQYWVAVGWYVLFTAIAAATAVVVIRLLYRVRVRPGQAEPNNDHLGDESSDG